MRYVKNRFESCYGWEKVMEMILECLAYYSDEGDFQIDCQTSIKAWLSEYGGWGLLYTLLPMETQQFLMFIYAHLSAENVVLSNEEMFEGLMDLYERRSMIVSRLLKMKILFSQFFYRNLSGPPRVIT